MKFRTNKHGNRVLKYTDAFGDKLRVESYERHLFVSTRAHGVEGSTSIVIDREDVPAFIKAITEEMGV